MLPQSFINDLKDKIFSVDERSFNGLAIEIFRFQSEYNPVYKRYVDLLGIQRSEVKEVEQIPFLPIELFKTHKILIEGLEPVLTFESSGTTGMVTSKHYVYSEDIYKKSIVEGFKKAFGNPAEWTFLALLPSYLERNNSSLVYMVNYLMQLSNKAENGFYLNEFDNLADQLNMLKGKEKVMLIGVSFALLDFAEQHKVDLSKITVMETGGMKGRRRELTRQELHTELKDGLQKETIASEYGMTELLSQAYALKDGIFESPSWMQVRMRETNDPFSYVEQEQAGGVNVIDLANVASCSFIATQDLGRAYGNKFEIIGRFDNSDIRGCSLMAL